MQLFHTYVLLVIQTSFGKKPVSLKHILKIRIFGWLPLSLFGINPKQLHTLVGPVACCNIKYFSDVYSCMVLWQTQHLQTMIFSCQYSEIWCSVQLNYGSMVLLHQISVVAAKTAVPNCDFSDSFVTLYKSGMAIWIHTYFLVGSSYRVSCFLTKGLN